MKDYEIIYEALLARSKPTSFYTLRDVLLDELQKNLPTGQDVVGMTRTRTRRALNRLERTGLVETVNGLTRALTVEEIAAKALRENHADNE